MRPDFKVVFDTNVYISAVIFGGNPRACLELARNGKIELFCSRKILFELSQKMKVKFKWETNDIFDLIEGIAKFAKIVKPKAGVDEVKEDPSDNKILECALEAKADFIVSGDIKHLLSMRRFKNIRILNSKDFLDLYYE